MTVRLPSRYEDLDVPFRASLKPNLALLNQVKRGYAAMQVAGDIRFLPIFGRSGSGKTSAAMELGTHFPEARVIALPHTALSSQESLLAEVRANQGGLFDQKKFLIAVVDQYEENVPERAEVPARFVEQLSLLDRGPLKAEPVLFLWLTTSREFRDGLAEATKRNERLLLQDQFELTGPEKAEWPDIIEETFRFHNANRPLADFDILRPDLESTATTCPTIGAATEHIASKLADHSNQLQTMSDYQVVMLWPVTDGTRIQRIIQFTQARDGYKLDWNSFFRELNTDDRRQLPLEALNRARLYFDVRLVPIAAADLADVCRSLDDDDYEVPHTGMSRFMSTHFYSVVAGTWNSDNYAPLRERDSARATNAADWYSQSTKAPGKLERRIAKCFTQCDLPAVHEHEIKTSHGSVRADVFVTRQSISPNKIIIELKAFSPENTMPSTIKDQVRITLRRHAQLAGFLPRQ